MPKGATTGKEKEKKTGRNFTTTSPKHAKERKNKTPKGGRQGSGLGKKKGKNLPAGWKARTNAI